MLEGGGGGMRRGASRSLLPLLWFKIWSYFPNLVMRSHHPAQISQCRHFFTAFPLQFKVCRSGRPTAFCTACSCQHQVCLSALSWTFPSLHQGNAVRGCGSATAWELWAAPFLYSSKEECCLSQSSLLALQTQDG